MITDVYRLVELLPGAAVSITNSASGRTAIARWVADNIRCEVPYDDESTPEDVAASLKAEHAAKAKRVVT